MRDSSALDGQSVTPNINMRKGNTTSLLFTLQWPKEDFLQACLYHSSTARVVPLAISQAAVRLFRLHDNLSTPQSTGLFSVLLQKFQPTNCAAFTEILMQKQGHSTRFPEFHEAFGIKVAFRLTLDQKKTPKLAPRNCDALNSTDSPNTLDTPIVAANVPSL
ncbi:hypothetical protein HYE67_009922 [Fusarium culmorum]|uniref:Uncharacterized protein n=1 Tax=Fusarium culmorum TaxID=5516 RepID=A0A2T4HCL7_FUSCU|nr:hypothetical protein FCULG_00004864 [Fusarium culmorum]QPC67691.1 hypothetical protein HYE67_009922 [Fusarium culmorum]